MLAVRLRDDAQTPIGGAEPPTKADRLALRPDLFEGSGDLARMAERERRGPLVDSVKANVKDKAALCAIQATFLRLTGA
jgi:hypothetical protein